MTPAITNTEKILKDLVLSDNGITDLECSFKHWINSPRTYICEFERNQNITLNHIRFTTENGKRCTRYQCDNANNAKRIIDFLNLKAGQRGETAITAEQERQILRRYA